MRADSVPNLYLGSRIDIVTAVIAYQPVLFVTQKVILCHFKKGRNPLQYTHVQRETKEYRDRSGTA